MTVTVSLLWIEGIGSVRTIITVTNGCVLAPLYKSYTVIRINVMVNAHAPSTPFCIRNRRMKKPLVVSLICLVCHLVQCCKFSEVLGFWVQKFNLNLAAILCVQKVGPTYAAIV